MAKAKKLVLEHIHFGKVTVKGAWSLDSSGEKYLDCLCSDGNHKLLVSSEYWISDPSDVNKAHDIFYAKELLRRKTLAAKTRVSEANAKTVSPDKRRRAIASTQNEIDTLEDHLEELTEDIDENSYATCEAV